MSAYINGTGIISAQETFSNTSFLERVINHPGLRMNAIEPDYNGLIDSKSIRRMSRIMRMTSAAALAALKEANTAIPDAIITGTAFGCLEDTASFLTKMITNNEEALNPTPFMQSTHNTLGSQVALMINCLGYNQTYVHRAFSFEAALTDALMLLEETPQQNILAGGVDETTDTSHHILSRFNLFNERLKQGEGSAFFILSGSRAVQSYAKVANVSMIYKPASAEILKEKISSLLERWNVSLNEIDLVLSGMITGRKESIDPAALFKNQLIIPYKSLCGEYPTASAFATWMAATILKTKSVPPLFGPTPPALKKILICNSYFGIHYSLILIEAC